MTLACWIPPITPIKNTNNFSTNSRNTTFFQIFKLKNIAFRVHTEKLLLKRWLSRLTKQWDIRIKFKTLNSNTTNATSK
jgi:hypothetical protein